MTEKYMIKKVCLAGDSMVGKTSLIRRFVLDMFDDKYLTTLGAKVSKKEVVAKDDKGDDVNMTMMIWDIMGLVGFRAELHRAHFKGAKGALIVCDITRRDTLDTLGAWADSLTEEVGKIPMIFLANKWDLKEKAEFTEEELKQLAEKYKSHYLFTSARSGENVINTFNLIAKNMLEESTTHE